MARSSKKQKVKVDVMQTSKNASHDDATQEMLDMVEDVKKEIAAEKAVEKKRAYNYSRQKKVSTRQLPHHTIDEQTRKRVLTMWGAIALITAILFGGWFFVLHTSGFFKIKTLYNDGDTLDVMKTDLQRSYQMFSETMEELQEHLKDSTLPSDGDAVEAIELEPEVDIQPEEVPEEQVIPEQNDDSELPPGIEISEE
jgi:hypothetical protein